VICTAFVSGVQLGSRSQAWPLGRWEGHVCENIPGDLAGQLGIHTTLYTHAIALACAFALLSSLHVVIGELVPKTVSLAPRERVALLVACLPLVPEHFSLGNPFARSDIGCDRKGFGSQFSASSWRGAFNGKNCRSKSSSRERGLIAPGERSLSSVP